MGQILLFAFIFLLNCVFLVAISYYISKIVKDMQKMQWGILVSTLFYGISLILGIKIILFLHQWLSISYDDIYLALMSWGILLGGVVIYTMILYLIVDVISETLFCKFKLTFQEKNVTVVVTDKEDVISSFLNGYSSEQYYIKFWYGGEEQEEEVEEEVYEKIRVGDSIHGSIREGRNEAGELLRTEFYFDEEEL